MKKYFIKYYFILTLFLLLSCSDSFSPQGEFQKGYTLYCILDNSKEIQKVYLFENYLPDGLNAESYNKNRTVENAIVKINDGISDFIFKETKEFIDSLGYSVTYYQSNNFNPANNVLRITASIPGEKTLTGTSDVSTKSVVFNFQTKRPLEYNTFTSYDVLFRDDNPFEFLPALFINYSLIQNGDTTHLKKEIPINYYSETDRIYPSYPDLQERSKINYRISVIETAIRELAVENPLKKIKIENLTLNIIQVSYPLNIYYKANKTNRDGFTIKLQEPNISNIENGNGIFAYKNITSVNVSFAKSWESLFYELNFSF